MENQMLKYRLLLTSFIIILVSICRFQELNAMDNKDPKVNYVLKIYVSTNGNDSWSGKLDKPNKNKTDGPLASLERARDIIRELNNQNALPKGNVLVEVQEGTYEMSKAFELGPIDSGSDKDSRIIYSAKQGKEVHLLAGKALTKWTAVTNTEILSRLNPEVRDKIRQTDLHELGITNFGSPGGNGMELFFNNEAMWLSRDPIKDL